MQSIRNIRISCTNSDLATPLLRFAIAITFMLSGISKGANLVATSQLIGQYCGLLGLDRGFGISSYVIAAVICSFEIFLGMVALNSKTFLLALPISLFGISLFTILTYINLVAPFGGIESCGCFGELIHLNATETFCKNIALLIASVYLAYRHRHEIASCYVSLKDNVQNLGRSLVLYAVAAIFPICISVCLDNGVYTHRVFLYYLITLVCVIFAAYISKRSNAMPSSSADGGVIKP